MIGCGSHGLWMHLWLGPCSSCTHTTETQRDLVWEPQNMSAENTFYVNGSFAKFDFCWDWTSSWCFWKNAQKTHNCCSWPLHIFLFLKHVRCWHAKPTCLYQGDKLLQMKSFGTCRNMNLRMLRPIFQNKNGKYPSAQGPTLLIFQRVLMFLFFLTIELANVQTKGRVCLSPILSNSLKEDRYHLDTHHNNCDELRNWFGVESDKTQTTFLCCLKNVCSVQNTLLKTDSLHGRPSFSLLSIPQEYHWHSFVLGPWKHQSPLNNKNTSRELAWFAPNYRPSPIKILKQLTLNKIATATSS